MRFSLGEFDVAYKVGIGNFLFEGMVCMETKNIVLFPLMCLDGRCDLPPPCAKWKNSFAVDISQVALSGADWRFWREDLASVDVLMTADVVAMVGLG